MKKLLAAVLAAAMTLSMGVVSFAADVTPTHATGPNSRNVTPDELRFDDAKFATGADKINHGLLTPAELADDTVIPGKKIYFRYTGRSSEPVNFAYADKDYIKVKVDKGDNSKAIESVKVLEKYIGARHFAAIEISLKDFYIDDETKLNPTVTFTAKKYIVMDQGDVLKVCDTLAEATTAIAGTSPVYFAPGEKVEIVNFDFWVNNEIDSTDSDDYAAGTKGHVIKPTKNEDNDYTWNNNNDDLAKLEFEADDDVVKIYAKLSTKWDNQDYEEYFADSDAFFFNFVSNPVVSSTSRALLTIYNPFVDDDDDLSVDADEIKVYEVVDGELVDSKLVLGENEDGDSVFTMKTRQLGTYIIAGPKGAGAEEVATAVPTGLVLPSRG